MKTQKIQLAFLGLMLIVGFPLSGQEILDPNSRLYELIAQWENNGLVEKLPQNRPYPPKVLVDILQKVSAASPTEAALAAKYLKELTGKMAFSVNVSQTSRGTTELKYAGDSQTQVMSRFDITDLLDLQLQFNGYILDHTDGDLLPTGQASSLNFFEDAAGFTVKGRDIKTRMAWTSDVSFGTKDYYLQAGFHRSTFGPLPSNSIVMGGQAPFIPQIGFTANDDLLSYSTIMMMLSATNSLGSNQLYPNKYMFMHDIRFYPTSAIEFSLYESTLYGGRFDPTYLLPTGPYFFNQAFGGNSDNPQLGMTGTIKFPSNIKFAMAILADDLSFNDLIRLKITKVKAAGEFNLSWTPLTDLLRQVSLDYTIITPYTFSHVFNDNGAQDPWKVDSVTGLPTGVLLPNYLNYTHMGKSLGATLDPNSDRLTIKVDLQPTTDFNVGLRATMVRHGNASEGRSWINADGTIFDDGYNNQIANGGYQFNNSTPFLNQKVILVTLIGAISLKYDFHLAPNMDLALSGDYYLEHRLDTYTHHLIQGGANFITRF